MRQLSHSSVMQHNCDLKITGDSDDELIEYFLARLFFLSGSPEKEKTISAAEREIQRTLKSVLASLAGRINGNYSHNMYSLLLSTFLETYPRYPPPVGPPLPSLRRARRAGPGRKVQTRPAPAGRDTSA